MGIRVAIDKATLKLHRACRAAYTSPEWNEAEQALIYEDWDATVKRHLAMGFDKDGIHIGLYRLEWFVNHGLVPMTREELNALKKAHGGSDNG
jgi:hypothetical protein